MYPPHIHFGYVSGYITFAQFITVRKGHNAGKWIDFRDDKPFVLLHFTGDIIKIVSYAQRAKLPLIAVLVCDLHLQPCHWRVL